ncbi:MAG: hypothetical protein FJW88_09395 [Actinobacteria bacterium]|nr:hypothetical protein [Actinomycetota bacterium]
MNPTDPANVATDLPTGGPTDERVAIPGILLTGGESRRMGVPKPMLLLDGEPLAARSGRVLAAVCGPVVEVGPGCSGLVAVPDDVARSGPLGGVLTGVRALGVAGPVMVLGCDLPSVDEAVVRAIASHPGVGTVVPLDADGEPQVVCARYSVVALARAAHLFAAGRRSLRLLLDLPDVTTWAVADPRRLADVDTPEDARRFGITVPR